MTTPAIGSCPLCREPATLTDWRPGLSWIGVEGCRCRGYFVRPEVLERRPDDLQGIGRSGPRRGAAGNWSLGRGFSRQMRSGPNGAPEH